MKNIVLLAMLIALTGSIPILENDTGNAENSSESRENMMIRYRLPNNTLPRLYNIIIEPNMDDEPFSWNGKSSIDFEVLETTKIVTLHAYKNLAIDESFTELVDIDFNKYKPIGHHRDDEVEFLKLEFDRDIPVGNYSLNLKYNGVDTQQVTGFYKASYPPSTYPNVVATHFEATTARRAFPCWDEPGLKARYRISIKHFPNYTAISNMPEIERVETEDSKFLTTFDTTPIMSTYLLTFVISDYESISNEFGNITVWANKYDLEQAQHILNTSQKVVDVMEAYTGLPFGFPRLGSVLVPLYSAAATEHWGLVTYISRAVDFNSSIDRTSKLNRINLLIAHELSHSWFGNRISPKWWNHIWLNEGFAAYFQYYIMDEINGYSEDTGLFVMRNNHRLAFIVDSSPNDVYVTWTPITNIEIRRMFGQIIYRKGAAIIHMFRHVLTDDVFRAGIIKYLTKHSYKAVDTNDLMAALQEAYDENANAKTPLNIKESMMTWLMQTGYPIINVTRNYTTGETNITQRSIIIDETSKKWRIPLNYATKTDLNFSSTSPWSWINETQHSVVISGIDKDDWIIFNIQASGYYRVNYDDENWKRIIEYMNTDNYKNIHVLNRAQLINDVDYLAMQEPSKYKKYFWELIEYLSREIDYLPWSTAMYTLQSIDNTLSGTEIHEKFQKYILGLMNSLIEKVGYETFDNDDEITKLTKQELVEWACLSGHSGCAEFSAPRLLQYLENPIDNRLHPDNIQSIFCAGIRQLNYTATKRVIDWVLMNNTDILSDILGCTENHQIHKDVMNKMRDNFSDDRSTIQSWNAIMVGSEENFNFAIDFLIENHEKMINSSTTHDREYLKYLMSAKLYEHIKSKTRLEKFKKILDLKIMDEINETPKSQLLRDAENMVTLSEETVANLQLLLDKKLLSDNIIRDTNIDI